MNQSQIGAFLKALRKEKAITQEQLAQKLGVSNRTVSRWETGFNMPDLDILIELADFYNVEIREILNGERKRESMNYEEKDIAMQMADYSNAEQRRFTKMLQNMFRVGSAAGILAITLQLRGMTDAGTGAFVAAFCQGLILGIMIVGGIFTSRYAARIRRAKKRILNQLTGRGNSDEKEL